MVPAPQLILRTVERWFLTTPSVGRLLRPAHYQWQNLRYWGLVRRNRILKDRFRGRRCFVLGTGISVNDVDFDLLSNEYVFACNLLAKHRDFHRLKVSFYSVITPPQHMYGESTAPEAAQYAVYAPPDGIPIRRDNADAVLKNLFSQTPGFHPSLDKGKRGPFPFFSAVEKACPDPDTIWFLNARGYRFFEAEKLFRDRRVFYVVKARPSVTPVYDIAGPTSFVDGGLPFAITTAIYMGFKEIVLCGCGYTYHPRQEFHFYDSPVLSTDFSESEAFRWSSKLAEIRGVELHSVWRASDGYRPMFVRHQPVAEIHRIVHDFARAQGVTILNLTPDGFDSPVYAAIRWQALKETIRGCASGQIVSAGVEG